MKTIKLQGRDYVQVNERVAEFNKLYPSGMIAAEPVFKDNTVYFKAVITPSVDTPQRFFVGHSFGELGKEKALEKLETVAVGRALAFMGIGIVQGLASADEMSNFYKKTGDQPFIGKAPKVELKPILKPIYNKSLNEL